MPSQPNLSWRGLGGLVLVVFATSCIPKMKPLDVTLDVLSTFRGGPEGEGPELDVLRADAIFDDPDLVALIDQALANNRELGVLTQELGASRAEVIAKRGAVWPHLGVGAGGGLDKPSQATSQGVSDEAHGLPVPLGDLRIDLQASWEIDVWKKLRNETQAARERYLASAEGRTFFATGLVAEVSETWYELLTLDRQLAVVQQNTALIEDGLQMVRLEQQAARVTLLGVQRFEAELLRNQARSYEIQQQITVTENRLNLLVGRPPQPIQRDPDGFLALPLGSMNAGLPAQLLLRRPDIRAAERDLSAAKLDVKVARARFLPSLAIDAKLGIEAFNPASFAALPASALYGIAAGVLAPLINRNEITAGYAVANARQSEAALEYEQTVLIATVDVANQISAITNADAGFDRKTAQVERLEAAIETSNQLFRSARADYLEVLTTRREALEAELELLDTRLAQVRARIRLYRALGGDWPGIQPADPSAKTLP